MKTKDIHFIKWILVSIILFGIIFLWNFQAFGQDWTTEQKEVWISVQGFWENIKKGDVEATLAGQHDKMLTWFTMDPNPLKKKGMRSQYGPIPQKKANLCTNYRKQFVSQLQFFSSEAVCHRQKALIMLIVALSVWVSKLFSFCPFLSRLPLDLD